jgi:uncharacterized coiled-coil protein SlyX
MFKRFYQRPNFRLLSLAGAFILTSTLIGAPALADTQRVSVQLAGMTNGQITDCVAFVREQRRLAAENGVTMSRRDQKTLLHDCNNGQLEARIAEQERILAALDAEIRQFDLELDEQAQILDHQGRVLAKIIAVNGQLIMRAQDADQRIAAKLQEAERILQRLAAS